MSPVGGTAIGVSVAVATYNGERFLREQLLSIVDQTVSPDEIIVSDDGSHDATVAVAQEVFAQHPLTASGRIRTRILRHPTPTGVVANFSAALEATVGELVALSDQDDRWMPDRLERAVELFAGRPALLLVHGDAILVDAAGRPAGRLFDALELTRRERTDLRDGRALDAYLRRNLATGATMIMRRGLWQQALPVPAGWVHDEWLAIVAASTGEVAVIEDPLIEYRQHGGNEIGAARPDAGVRLGRLRAQREERNARLLQRAESLADRFAAPSSAVAASDLDRAREKVVHERARSGYPASRLRRIGPVVRELASGRYARYGRGAIDVLRDLAQPGGNRPSRPLG